jgi:mannosyl-oligosaccharide alpha-1,2-mannosidase
MGLDTEFDQAVRAIEQIDFSSSSLEEINVFETTIRYLGGFLAAYDLSGGKYPSLLRKAVELGDMLYVAFDTPNHLPITRWKLQDARNPAIHQTAQETVLVAEIGSLTLEFTRLSQLSGNPKYYDAVQRIMDVFASQQDDTKIPGIWPIAVNAKKANFTEYGMFTIGGMADSLYEYLPKACVPDGFDVRCSGLTLDQEYLLLGGGSQQYRDLYIKALSVMKKAIFFRPMTKEGSDILLPGNVASDGTKLPSGLRIEPKVQHLGCFAGGMVGLAARAFSLPQDLTLARQLVEGCLWAYENSASGIMPESMFTTNCPTLDICDWDETLWHKDLRTRHPEEGQSPDIRATISKSRLTPGITKIEDRRYILRPEAIESVFILYRLTGDETLMDRAWNMFQTIVKYTQTGIAHAALDDCVAEHPEATRADRMESFWLAETLKYFYLIFESPDVVSLDEYVLNTEAHPLRRPK